MEELDNFRRAAKIASGQECAVTLKNNDPSLPSQVGVSNRSVYTNDNDFVVNIAIIKLQNNKIRYIEYGIYYENGTARVLRTGVNLVQGGNQIGSIQEISQTNYDKLSVKDPDTLYIIPK